MREIRNAIIKRTSLGFEGHGIMTCNLDTRSGALGQGFGGYCLGGQWGMEFIVSVLRALEVESWEQLVGTHCRVDASREKIHRIGHIIEDKWFDPEKDLAQYVPKDPVYDREQRGHCATENCDEYDFCTDRAVMRTAIKALTPEGK